MIKDLIIYILFIVIIILYKTKELYTFINTDSLEEIVKTDKQAISNILNFTNKFVRNNDSYDINKNITVKNLSVNSDCLINGNITIKNKLSFNFSSNEINNMFLDVLPRYSIINFHNDISKLPKRWVLCDGKKWYINKTDENDIKGYDVKIAPENRNNIYEIITVPDLQGRFLLGYDKDHPFKSTGGKDKEIITPEQLPNHYHPSIIVRNKDNAIFKYASYMPYSVDKAWLDIDYGGSGSYILDTNKYGNIGTNNNIEVEPHENMPQYFVSRYIIKI